MSDGIRYAVRFTEGRYAGAYWGRIGPNTSRSAQYRRNVWMATTWAKRETAERHAERLHGEVVEIPAAVTPEEER